jgi:hypothetical protein
MCVRSSKLSQTEGSACNMATTALATYPSAILVLPPLPPPLPPDTASPFLLEAHIEDERSQVPQSEMNHAAVSAIVSPLPDKPRARGPEQK